jgi:hypothetical protein
MELPIYGLKCDAAAAPDAASLALMDACRRWDVASGSMDLPVILALGRKARAIGSKIRQTVISEMSDRFRISYKISNLSS